MTDRIIGALILSTPRLAEARRRGADRAGRRWRITVADQVEVGCRCSAGQPFRPARLILVVSLALIIGWCRRLGPVDEIDQPASRDQAARSRASPEQTGKRLHLSGPAPIFVSGEAERDFQTIAPMGCVGLGNRQRGREVTANSARNVPNASNPTGLASGCGANPIRSLGPPARSAVQHRCQPSRAWPGPEPPLPISLRKQSRPGTQPAEHAFQTSRERIRQSTGFGVNRD